MNQQIIRVLPTENVNYILHANSGLPAYKKTPAIACRCLLAPPEVEYLNLVWRDFKKVVRFIDENHNWLLPMLGRMKKS